MVTDLPAPGAGPYDSDRKFTRKIITPTSDTGAEEQPRRIVRQRNTTDGRAASRAALIMERTGTRYDADVREPPLRNAFMSSSRDAHLAGGTPVLPKTTSPTAPPAGAIAPARHRPRHPVCPASTAPRRPLPRIVGTAPRDESTPGFARPFHPARPCGPAPTMCDFYRCQPQISVPRCPPVSGCRSSTGLRRTSGLRWGGSRTW